MTDVRSTRSGANVCNGSLEDPTIGLLSARIRHLPLPEPTMQWRSISTENMKSFLRRFLLATLLCTCANAFAEPAKCPIAGEVEEWATDLCMFAAETDDLLHPDVGACLSKQPKVHPVNACSAKRKYKTEICSIVVRGHAYPGSVEQCVRDQKFFGPAVRGGELQRPHE